ncbi:DEAD/DEAH box helicase [Paenibacillus ihuae]|uniref:DEAD/DEAH box helicase n=1 Tax=Paenibacillus ihuae TaxID=1232431 RepID=UPI000A4CC5B8|nr:DEAD/DEAH box helicase [Paenibacillus ihuae]
MDWQSLEAEYESDSVQGEGIFCIEDGSPIMSSLLMTEEVDLLLDRRLPLQESFHSSLLAGQLVDLSKRIRADVFVHETDEIQGVYDEHIPMESWMRSKLESMGINKLYKHQGEAVEAVRQGRNVVICTKTASGKSLSYNIPIIEKLVADPNACALYLSPFKALVEDQFAHLQQWTDLEEESVSNFKMAGFSKLKVHGTEVPAGLLFGQRNIPQHKRKDQASNLVFEQGRYWLTNVHYLHPILQCIGAQTGKASQLIRFLTNLRYIVIDELHHYSGMIGSKVAMVIRRLRMLCERLGNREIQFIACSATIANPKQLVEELTGKRGIQGFHEVMESNAPINKKDIVLWNPGLIDIEHKRRAVASDLYEILKSVYSNGQWPRSIIFSSNRQQSQLLSRELNIILRTHLNESGSIELKEGQDLFLPYHANLPQEIKEQTIKKLQQGEILGLVTTKALEVGIDVDSLDICIMLGYPGSHASFWQQAGRVGRSRDGLVVMMLQEEPLQQYYARNPLEFFQQIPESAAININNPKILREHLVYAAHEQGGTIYNAINYVRAGVLRKVLADVNEQWQQAEGKLVYMGESPKYQPLIAMGETYTVVSKSGWNETILFQNVDTRSLIRDYHVDAVFLGSDNRSYYKVKWIDKRQRKVLVEQVRSDYLTRGIVRDSIEVSDINKLILVGNELKANIGNIVVKRNTFGYKKIYTHNAKPSETVQVTNTYPVSFQTDALWLLWDEQGKSQLRNLLTGIQAVSDLTFEELLDGSIHAAEHALAAAIPAIVKCSAADFQHVSFHSSSTLFGMPGLFIYDSQVGGGSGIVEVVAEKFAVLLEKAKLMMTSCSCSNGCPSCVQLFQCERQNEPLHKVGGLVVIQSLQKYFEENL